MEDQAHQQPQAAATQELGDLSSTRGPSTTKVVMLVLLSGVLLLLAGVTLLGTLIGLTVTAPLFILFSPVLIPAALTIGLVVTGFLTVVAFVLTVLFFFMRMNSLRTRMRERYTIPGGEHEDAVALNSLTSLGRSDSRPSASVDNGKGSLSWLSINSNRTTEREHFEKQMISVHLAHPPLRWKIFSDLREKYEKEDVDKWTQALREVANLNGWPSKTAADGWEAELVKLVVTRVWSELKNAFQLVVATEQPVGIDNAVEEVLRLLVANKNRR
ncbi:hypothetical protein NL676_036557 [Syzygium grande]|nr:hypothetical protein NL676_036557 [Syzygium grande]